MTKKEIAPQRYSDYVYVGNLGCVWSRQIYPGRDDLR